MELHHPPVNLKVVTVIFGQALMSRNFGIGSRDMFVAGRMILQRRSRNGFKTQHDYADRWRLFCSWASEQNVKKMENVTPGHSD